jgi:uncharacterized glyoxalase superfamily protein PhnB
VKNTPPGWPRVSASLFYKDASKAIDWLVRAFDFEVRLKVEGDDGRIVHSELAYGDGMVMVGESGENPRRPQEGSWRRSPLELDGKCTQGLMVFVDDVEAHFTHAVASGAKVVVEPITNDYGEEYWTDRSYQVEDLEGHHWWFVQRLRHGGGPADAGAHAGE